MNPAMITAAVTMGQLQKKIDTIGNNLANMNTNGYKSRETQFSDLLFQQVDNLSRANDKKERLTPTGIRVGYGAGIGETNMNLKRGTIRQTDRPLDVALDDPYQFFEIETARDSGKPARTYTRDGEFYLQPDAANPNLLNLVTKDGDFVRGTTGRIQIPANYKSITINKQGVFDVTLADGRRIRSGRLALVNVLRPQLMESVGDNQFTFPDLRTLNVNEADVLRAVAAGEASVEQGALETSNVDFISQMTELTDTQRAYQLGARAVSVADETMQVINTIR
jgi:flagellar basal-body rod protein FlgG